MLGDVAPSLCPACAQCSEGPRRCHAGWASKPAAWSKVLSAAHCEHQPGLQGDPKGRGRAVAHPRGAHPVPGLTTSPRCLSLHTGEFRDPGDRQRRVQPALASPFPSARPPLGYVSDAGICLEAPGLPNLPSPVSSTSCVYLPAKSPCRREEEEGGEPLPLPLWAWGALLRRRSRAPQLLSNQCPPQLLAELWPTVLFGDDRRGGGVSRLALPPMEGQ